MFNHVGKKIFSLMLLMLFTAQSASALEDNNLTNTQLYAVMGVVTNMILLSNSEVFDIFVSLDGSDNASGDIHNPLLTLEAARNKARKLKKNYVFLAPTALSGNAHQS